MDKNKITTKIKKVKILYEDPYKINLLAHLTVPYNLFHWNHETDDGVFIFEPCKVEFEDKYNDEKKLIDDTRPKTYIPHHRIFLIEYIY